MANTNNTNANTSILEDPFWKEAFEELDRSFAFDELCKKGEEVYRLADCIDDYIRDGEIDKYIHDGDIDKEIHIGQHLIFFEFFKERRVPDRSSTRGFIDCCNRLAFFDEKEVTAHCRWVFKEYFEALNKFCKAFVEYRQKYVFSKRK